MPYWGRDGEVMKSLLERYKEYIPNTSTDLAMVLVETVAPKQAFWPMRITQLIGGKTWSISLITHKPARVNPGVKP